MEIFNSRRWLGMTIISTICVLFGLALNSCDSKEDEFFMNEAEQSGNIISLSDGSKIELIDTTTYILDLGEIENDTDYQTSDISDIFTATTRASGVLRAYGYDSQEPETGWKKYYLKGDWETKYGIQPAIYIGRYVKVHKNLSVEKGTYAVAADYTSDKAPKNVMGWKGKTGTIGFIPTLKSDYVAEGETRIFIINCDLSGRVYNKTYPADPSNFVWTYKLEEDQDLWD